MLSATGHYRYFGVGGQIFVGPIGHRDRATRAFPKHPKNGIKSHCTPNETPARQHPDKPDEHDKRSNIHRPTKIFIRSARSTHPPSLTFTALVTIPRPARERMQGTSHAEFAFDRLPGSPRPAVDVGGTPHEPHPCNRLDQI